LRHEKPKISLKSAVVSGLLVHEKPPWTL